MLFYTRTKLAIIASLSDKLIFTQTRDKQAIKQVNQGAYVEHYLGSPSNTSVDSI